MLPLRNARIGVKNGLQCMDSLGFVKLLIPLTAFSAIVLAIFFEKAGEDIDPAPADRFTQQELAVAVLAGAGGAGAHMQVG